MKVRILKEFNFKRVFGEVEFFPYQWAFGISVRYLKCEGMGWMFRMYLGPIKIWFNLRNRKRGSKNNGRTKEKGR